jgi:hypothetical protein
VAGVIDRQERLRDRFLFALLAGTGRRIGQPLGSRHEDVTRSTQVSSIARLSIMAGSGTAVLGPERQPEDVLLGEQTPAGHAGTQPAREVA